MKKKKNTRTQIIKKIYKERKKYYYYYYFSEIRSFESIPERKFLKKKKLFQWNSFYHEF
jgi:hypothetical protein